MSGSENVSLRDDCAAATELRIPSSGVVRDQRHPRELEDSGFVATEYFLLSDRSAKCIIQQT